MFEQTVLKDNRPATQLTTVLASVLPVLRSIRQSSWFGDSSLANYMHFRFNFIFCVVFVQRSRSSAIRRGTAIRRQDGCSCSWALCSHGLQETTDTEPTASCLSPGSILNAVTNPEHQAQSRTCPCFKKLHTLVGSPRTSARCRYIQIVDSSISVPGLQR